MGDNYTPLNSDSIGVKQRTAKKTNNLNTILIIIATLTTVVLGVVLAILVQRRLQIESEAQQLRQRSQPVPTVSVPTPPTGGPTPQASPSAGLDESSSATQSAPLVPIASPSAVITP